MIRYPIITGSGHSTPVDKWSAPAKGEMDRPASLKGASHADAGGMPAAESEEVRAILGRAVDGPGFRKSLVIVVPLVLFVPCMLIAWAVWGGSSDTARGSQIGWGIVLAVIGVGGLARATRIGTEVAWTGVRRHRFFSSQEIDWVDVRGLTTEWGGRMGVWLVVRPGAPEGSDGSDLAVMVPSEFHPWSMEQASDVVVGLNSVLAVRRAALARRGPGSFERFCAWTCFLPVVTLGLAAVPVVIAAAATGRRLWMWIVALATFDATVVGIATSADQGPGAAVGAVLFVCTVVGSTTALMVGWLHTRLVRRRHLRG